MSNVVKYEEQVNEMQYFEKLCKTAMSSGKYPAEMNQATMLNIMLTAKDLGISAMKAINGGFYIVNGKISMSTSLMTDRIRSSGHSIKVIEMSREKCVLIGRRRDNEDSCKIEFTMEDAKDAGLLGSPTWKKYPKVMLYNRAMSMLARVLFPDVVGNAYSEDERYDIANIPPHKRPEHDPSDMPMASIEVFDKAQAEEEQPKQIEELAPTIEELGTKMADLGFDIDLALLMDYVRLLSIKHNRTEPTIIKSALQNDEMLERFTASFIKSLEEKKKAV